MKSKGSFRGLQQPIISLSPPETKLVDNQIDRYVASAIPTDQPRSAQRAETQLADRWYIVAQVSKLAKKVQQDWSAIDYAKRQQWLAALLVSWLVTAVLLSAMTLFMRYIVVHGYLSAAWEERALLWVIHHAPIDFSHATWLGAAGDPIVIIPVFLIGTIVALRAGYPIRGLSIAASYLLVSLLVLLGWTIWDRARPTLVLDGIAAPDLHSFPSGHMAQSMAVYGMLWYFWLRKIRHKGEYFVALLLLAIWVGLIAIARLLLGAHWVTDIIAGTFIGLMWLLFLIRALRRSTDKEP